MFNIGSRRICIHGATLVFRKRGASNNVHPEEDGWTCSAESVRVHRQTSQTTTKDDRNERGGQTAFSPRLGNHQEDLHTKQCCSQTWSLQYWQSKKNMHTRRHRPFEKTRREQQRPPKGGWMDMQRRVSPCSSTDLADHHER